MSYKNFSQKSRLIKDGSLSDMDSNYSYDPKKTERIEYEEWTKFISYYRYYIDKFAVEILGMKNLFPFQRLILRAMGRHPNIMLICCRGLTKSYISAVFMVCMAILYPGIKIGIVSGTGNQARMVVKQKIEGELKLNENIQREIKGQIKVSQDDCIVNFKNGSSIRAFALGQGMKGSSSRGWRFQLILVDECALVDSKILQSVVEPMIITPRPNAIEAAKNCEEGRIGFENVKHEDARMIKISSATYKISDLYTDFIRFYNNMRDQNKNYFVGNLDYQVGIDAGLFTESFIEEKKSEYSDDIFKMEYGAQFVGSANDSFYPYEKTVKCRILEQCELKQPKGTNSIYVVFHDVATSAKNGSDNSATGVLKLTPTGRGTFYKDLVFLQTMNGASLKDQRDLLRDLIHIRFPNTEKLVIDVRSAGEGLLSILQEPWVYRGAGIEKEKEFPALILDNDDEARMMFPNASPIIRGITATNEFNAVYYPYLLQCVEDRTLRLLIPSNYVSEQYGLGEYSPEEFMAHIEQDELLQEMSNIKRGFSDNGNVVYERIIKKTKRDRCTSLMYGLSIVSELEKQGKADMYKKPQDTLEFLTKFIY